MLHVWPVYMYFNDKCMFHIHRSYSILQMFTYNLAILIDKMIIDYVL